MQYEIIAVRGHFEVYDTSGKFFCSADTYTEAQNEIESERSNVNGRNYQYSHAS